MPSEIVAEGFRVGRALLRDDVEHSARQESPEHEGHGRVHGEVLVHREAGVRRVIQTLRDGVEVVQQLPVLGHHRLGRAGRAGGVNDVRQIGGRHSADHVALTLPRHPRPVGVQANNLPVIFRQTFEQPPLRD